MSSPASIARHPIHPMLVVFPIGLWTFSLVCDVAYATGWGGPIWNDMAFYTMAGGLAGALLAAVPGFIDYLSLSGRIRAIALTHMLINLGIVGLYALNLFLRQDSAPGAVLPIALSSLGMVLLGVSGWLGGELVYVHNIGGGAGGGAAVEVRGRADPQGRVTAGCEDRAAPVELAMWRVRTP